MGRIVGALTPVSTLGILVHRGTLHRYEPALEPDELPERLFYETGTFRQWRLKDLSRLKARLDKVLTPLQQVESLIAYYVAGNPLKHPQQLHSLRPITSGVWEIKTPDVRIFGCFAMKDCFVAFFGDGADKIKNHDLYAGYRDEVVRLRNEMQLPHMATEAIDDVIA